MIKDSFFSIRQNMSEKGLDSIIISNPANIFYLTGFKGNGYLLVNSERAAMVTPAMFAEDAQFPEYEKIELIPVKDDTYETLRVLGRSFFKGKTGYESDYITCSTLQRLRSKDFFETLLPFSGIIESIREIKDKEEIELICKAQKIAEKTLGEIMGFICEGMEETEIANEIDYRMRKYGAEKPSFDTIVAFGANTSKPHAIPSRNKVSNGDFVLIDMGACFEGYMSDMTRTFVLGKATDEQKKVYGMVLDSQVAAIDKIKKGIGCNEAYNISNSIFAGKGYADKFIHSLGHGIGVEVHETPRLSPKSDVRLGKNMIVTVEPGLYFSGWGGVRIEDMVRVDENSCENLTSFPKNLIEL